MELDLNYIDGQTPIDEDEKEGLLIETISNKAELDEFEQLRIRLPGDIENPRLLSELASQPRLDAKIEDYML